MAIREGLRRVRIVGRVILVVGLLLDAFLVVGLVMAALNQRVAYFAIGYAGIPLTIVAICILLLAWIGEGFSLQRRSRSSSSSTQSEDPVQ